MRPFSNQTTEMFDSVVRNAIDFVEHSLTELEISPKYSLINFCAAVELFIKARLMLEHWSLVVEDPRLASLSSFQNGDFKSVGMENAVKRLKNIANITIDDREIKVFDELREHRNKLIHFSHPRYAKPPNESAIAEVVIEQCKAWFYLHRLITGLGVGTGKKR